MMGMNGQNRAEKGFSDLPYPPSEGAMPDRATAATVRMLYAGKDGELSAVSEYLYQAIRTERDYPYLSEALEQISISEMRHFKMLGELLLAMGEDPKFYAIFEGRGSRRGTLRWWSGEDPTYNFLPEELLRADIRAEKQAISRYQDAICSTGDEAVRRVLRRIAIDEQTHILTLERLLAEVAEEC